MEQTKDITYPLRVLHVIGKMDCGGAETLLMNLYRHIDREKIQFDFMVHVNEEGFYDKEIESLGGEIYHAPAFKIYNYIKYSSFWNEFFKENHEHRIVHGHIGSCAAIYLSIANKYNRYTIAHSHATKNQDIGARGIAFEIFSYPTRYIADYFMACSKQAGIDRYGNKVTSSKYFMVLKNAIDACKYQYNPITRLEIRRKMEVDKSQLIIGHVGRFSPEKNHHFILKVFEEILKEKKDSQLWLFGKGPTYSQIVKAAQNKGIYHAIRFMGVSEKIHEYLQGVDIFLFPSIYEGLGIAVIEAQAAGLPCFVSEAIVPEADIHAGLINRISLNNSVEDWSNKIVNTKLNERKNTFENVLNEKYDLHGVVEELMLFYLQCKK